MNPFLPGDPRPVHFVGIAGAGMSALAQVALGRGVPVSGTDPLVRSVAHLRAAGATIEEGPSPGRVDGARAVIVSAAIPPGHPEVVRATTLGIRILSRKEALAALVAVGKTIGIAGTHGKTTTTVMTTVALAAGGWRPTGLAGGFVTAWQGNALLGDSEWFVVEADEYDKAFLALSPTVAVINNVDVDHLECYGSENALDDAFVTFAGSAETTLVGTTGSRTDRVAARLGDGTLRFGPNAAIHWTDVAYEPTGTTARVHLPDGGEWPLRLRVLGEHNLRNAVGALGVVWSIGADVAAATGALAQFEGVGRRFQIRGEYRGITLVDDYAHHPAELRAVLAAARQPFPGRRLVAVFQPHLYSRTERCSAEMGAALADGADVAFVTAIYPAREEPIPGVTGEAVAHAVRASGGEGRYEPDLDALQAYLHRFLQPGDVVLTLGAGDISEWGARLANVLGEDPCAT